jgi:histone acetyltransferase (RNA polymerase elongator complex component)
MDSEVLLMTKRNHSVQQVYEAVECIKKYHVELGLQMMIGLPGDDSVKAIETAKILIGLKPETIRIYPTLIIKGTELETMYARGEYEPLTLEEAVKQVAIILPMFIKENIRVLRVGLQSNDGLNSHDLIAGPYHPAFKELVLDRIIYNEVMTYIESFQSDRFFKEDGLMQDDLADKRKRNYTISASSRLYNRLVGHKKKNKEKFEKLGIEIALDNELDNHMLKVFTEKSSTIFTTLF